MRCRAAPAVLLACASALLAAAPAHAHFAFVPAEAPARSFARLELQVPNERSGVSTVRVAVEIPDAVVFVRVPPTPGWQVRVEREPLDEPLLVGDRRVEERITLVEWSGGEISGSASASFRLRLAVPRAAGRTLEFRATQTYSNDEIVRWVEPPGSANPAPVLTVTAPDPSAESLRITRAPDPPPPPPPPASAETTTDPDDGEPEALPSPAAEEDEGGASSALVIALAVGLAALLAAAAWALAARRRRTD